MVMRWWKVSAYPNLLFTLGVLSHYLNLVFGSFEIELKVCGQVRFNIMFVKSGIISNFVSIPSLLIRGLILILILIYRTERNFVFAVL